MKHITTLIYAVSALISFVLIFRILFKFFAASPYSPFVAWTYTVSGNLVAPFGGIIPSLPLGGGALLDFPAIISVIVYLIALKILEEILERIVKR